MGLSEKWIGAEPHSAAALAAATAAFMRGATTQEVGGQTAAAVRSLERAAAFGEQAVAAAPHDEAVCILAADSQRIYSELLESVKRYSDALVHGRRALQLIEPLWVRRPEDPLLRLKLEGANSAAGMAEHHLGETDPKRLELALPYLRRSYELADEAMRADSRNVRNKSLLVAYCSRYCSLLVTMARFDIAAKLYAQAADVTRQLIVLDPKNRRSWYLLGTIQMDFGWMYFKSRKYAKARHAFLAADEGFVRGLEMDPADTVMLECRAAQFEGLARVAWVSGDGRDAREKMARSLNVMRGMVRRDASVKTYIFDYAGKLKFARDIGISTRDFD
jgi:tetratricopeptide (TPR) repeat protein